MFVEVWDGINNDSELINCRIINSNYIYSIHDSMAFIRKDGRIVATKKSTGYEVFRKVQILIDNFETCWGFILYSDSEKLMGNGN